VEAGNAYRILLGKPVLNEGQEGDWIRNHRWILAFMMIGHG
jgi:hypothetical protein